MPLVDVFDMAGTKTGQVELSDAIFGIKPNKPAMHAMVVNYLANQRQGTQSALTRAEVSGGGRKPWRQKGTGHARHGSTRSPQWRHGGVVFAPKPRSYRYRLNKKLRRLAMHSVLSSKVQNNELIVLDSINFEKHSTKSAVQMLKALNVDTKALVVLPGVNEIVQKSLRNIPGVDTALVNTINVYDILSHDKLILVKDTIPQIEEVYGNGCA